MNESVSTYVVKEGDTLSAIAEQHGTTVDELVALNQIENPDLIHPGQELKLKGDQPTEPSAEPSADETKTPAEQNNTQDAVLRENPM